MINLRSFAFILMLLCISFSIKSQTDFDYGAQPETIDEPLGFVRYNTFTLLYSAMWTSHNNHRAIALNNDGTIRFDKVISAQETTKPVQYSPTYDKGLLAISTVYFCSSWQDHYVNILLRIDSTGNAIFNLNPPQDIYTGVIQISGTQFIYSTDKYIKKFNGMTGAPTATICGVHGTITALNTALAQNIIVASDSIVKLIDTLGNTLVSKPNHAKYSKIKSYKKAFYGLRTNTFTIDKLDSVLDVVDSINTVITNPVTDFTIYNDSIAVSFYDNTTNLSSVKVYPVNTLANSITFSNNIAKHKIVALQKDSSYNILTAEQRTDIEIMCGFVCHLKHSTTGFTRVKTLPAITYTNDIVLKRVKTQYFTSSFFINQCSYNYKNSLVVQNNSVDTIKYFRISHPMHYFVQGSSNCGFHGSGKEYDTTVVLNLLPNDSLEIQMPLLHGNIFASSSSGINISICYDLSVPNHRLESNILNSSLCIYKDTASVGVGIEGYKTEVFAPEIYPNPTSSNINILSAKSIEEFSVLDLSGRTVISGKEAKEIDLSGLSTGMYFLSFKINDNSYTKKFVKE